MSGFSADWLALREPADHAARSVRLTAALDGWAKRRGRLRILDLGAGTGSSLRYLAPRLSVDQQWRLVDHDPNLLSRLPDALLDWARQCGYAAERVPAGLRLQIGGHEVTVGWTQADLAASALTGLAGNSDLMTASALLDLVSEAWIETLVRLCCEQRCAALMALTYDGRIEWAPRLPGDALVRDLLNRHQRRDKGFGPALGPAAAPELASRFAGVGQAIETEASDWRLGRDARDLQVELARGWADAAREMDPAASEGIQGWLVSRLGCADAGDSRLTVGHLDLLALPAER